MRTARLLIQTNSLNSNLDHVMRIPKTVRCADLCTVLLTVFVGRTAARTWDMQTSKLQAAKAVRHRIKMPSALETGTPSFHAELPTIIRACAKRMPAIQTSYGHLQRTPY